MLRLKKAGSVDWQEIFNERAAIADSIIRCEEDGGE
jgi:hypothetical protein